MNGRRNSDSNKRPNEGETPSPKRIRTNEISHECLPAIEYKTISSLFEPQHLREAESARFDINCLIHFPSEQKLLSVVDGHKVEIHFENNSVFTMNCSSTTCDKQSCAHRCITLLQLILSPTRILNYNNFSRELFKHSKEDLASALMMLMQDHTTIAEPLQRELHLYNCGKQRLEPPSLPTPPPVPTLIRPKAERAPEHEVISISDSPLFVSTPASAPSSQVTTPTSAGTTPTSATNITPSTAVTPRTEKLSKQIENIHIHQSPQPTQVPNNHQQRNTQPSPSQKDLITARQIVNRMLQTSKNATNEPRSTITQPSPQQQSLPPPPQQQQVLSDSIFDVKVTPAPAPVQPAVHRKLNFNLTTTDFSQIIQNVEQLLLTSVTSNANIDGPQLQDIFIHTFTHFGLEGLKKITSLVTSSLIPSIPPLDPSIQPIALPHLLIYLKRDQDTTVDTIWDISQALVSMYNVLDVNEVMLLACLKLHCWRGPPKLFVPQASDALKDLAEKQTCKCATCCIIREFTLDASCNVLEVPGLSKSDRHHVHFAWGKQRELIHSSTGPDEARVLVITKRFSTEDDMDRYKRIHDNETNEYKQVFFNVTSMYLLNASNQDKEASTLPPSSEASSSSTTASPTVHLDRAITECLNMNNVHIMIVVYAHLIKHNMVEKAIEAGFTFFKNLQDKPCQDKVNLAKDLLNKSMSHKTDPVSLWNCTMTMFRVNPSLNSYQSAKSSFTGSKQEWSKVSNELLSPLKNDLEYVPVCIACLHLEELYNDAHQYVVGLSNQLPKKLFELYSHQVRSLSDKKIPEVRVKLLFEEHLMDVIRTPFDNSRSRDVDSIILLFARVGYLMFAREIMEAKLLHLSKTLNANSNSYDAFGKWLLVAKQVFDLIDTEDSYNHWCSLITKVKTDHKNKKLFVTRIDEMLKVLQARPVRNNAPTASL